MPIYQNNQRTGQVVYNQDPRFQSSAVNNNYYGQTNRQEIRQIPAIPGRMINDPNEVMPQDIPMDGSVSLFPLSDWSCIYAKMWGNDGQIKTFKFVEEIPPNPIQQNAQEQASNTEILERLERIEAEIKKVSKKKPYKPYHKPNNKPQKEE